jgi:hypothetical protein
MGIGMLLGLFGRIPYAGRFLGSKWFWIILLVGGTIWFVDNTIDEYGDRIREQITTQIRANEYKNEVDRLNLERESLIELQQAQDERIEELTRQRESDRIAFQRRLNDLRNSGLDGGTIGPYLSEAARQATRPDGLAYEDVIMGLEHNGSQPEN